MRRARQQAPNVGKSSALGALFLHRKEILQGVPLEAASSAGVAEGMFATATRALLYFTSWPS